VKTVKTMAHVGIWLAAFYSEPIFASNQFDNEEELADADDGRDSTILWPRKMCTSSPPVRGVCLFQGPPASARGY
jgi:hypothetical protein